MRIIGLLILVGILCFVGGVITSVYPQRNRPAQGFLQSTAVRVQLGVWDKFDVDKTNHVVFVVSTPNGKQYKAERNESLDDWVYVNFPDDFRPYPTNTDIYTQYTWKCLVSGKTAASGRFMWGNSKAADNDVY
jgi:hypothetical protein